LRIREKTFQKELAWFHNSVKWGKSTQNGSLKLNSGYIKNHARLVIDHFTVVCSVTWPLYGSEARVDLVLIQTSLLLLCKTSCSDAN